MTMHKAITAPRQMDIIALLARARPDQIKRLASDILRSTEKAGSRK